MSDLIKCIIIFTAAFFMILIPVMAYDAYKGEKSRELYRECLQLTERVIAQSQTGSGIRIVSTPHCTLK